MQTHGGKGSTPRPVNKEKFDANWDRIFGGKKMFWQEISTLPKGLDEELFFRSEYGEIVAATPAILRSHSGCTATFPTIEEDTSFVGTSHSTVTQHPLSISCSSK